MTELLTALAAAALLLLFRFFVGELTLVDGRSMRTALENHDILWVRRGRKISSRIRRGDIVICRFDRKRMKRWPHWRVRLVKRVIAFPGETVEIRQGKVFIDNHPLEEPYLSENARRKYVNFKPVTVPEGMLFVMGDNRLSSLDSRRLGPVRTSDVLGRVTRILFPCRRHRRILRDEPVLLPEIILPDPEPEKTDPDREDAKS